MLHITLPTWEYTKLSEWKSHQLAGEYYTQNRLFRTPKAYQAFGIKDGNNV